jgi:hypothetical protein
MRKLNNLGPGHIDDSNEGRACSQYRFLRIHWPPICVKSGACSPVEANSKDLGEFLDTERANGDSEASEETLGIFSFLLIDAKQCVAVRFIKALRQIVQSASNTRRKTATQSIKLADDPSKPIDICERPV